MNLKTIIISSPSSAFIKVLYYQLSNLEIFRLNKYYMEKYKVKLIKNNKCSNSIITGTPIVLFENILLQWIDMDDVETLKLCADLGSAALAKEENSGE